MFGPIFHLIEYASANMFVHFWQFDWTEVMHIEVLWCSIALTLGGVLCAAAGIGGGGIIVTVLMVCGMLTPYDAVPLSKAVVFFGAMMQLALNWGKKATSDGSGQEKELIDWGIVRLIVPMALTGTLLGVLFNAGAPGWSIVAMLTVVLSSMTWATLQKGLEQRANELGLAAADNEETALLPGPRPPSAPAAPPAPVVDEQQKQDAAKAANSSMNYGMLFALLVLVIIGGVLRHHMGFCLDELAAGSLKEDITRGESACRHPVLEALFGNSMEKWMSNDGTAMGFMSTVMVVPVGVCLMIGFYFAHDLVVNQGWEVSKIMTYQVMALITGCLAGLVGIGGGLIFSPFLLIMGIDPATAVATSATCVIFTSSSTTMQYMFIDRIRMVLALWYGIVNLAASAGGTKLVHYCQDAFQGKKSLITFIVAAAVGISTILAVAKGIGEVQNEMAHDLKTPING